MKKDIFCCTESVTTTPKSHDHMPTTSLWRVAAKWPTQASKTKLILCPRDHKDTAVSVWQDFERVPVFHGVCEIALTEVLATQMGVMQRSNLRKSACLNCINLIHFCLTAGRLRRSSGIVIPGVICELLQFVATQ